MLWRVIVGGLTAAICICAWEGIGRVFSIVRLLVSYPSLIVAYTADNAPVLLRSFGVTAVESVAGLLAASALAGVLVGACLYVPSMYRVILPPVLVSQVVPLVTLAPFFILAFGVGVLSKIAMATLLSFFPIFVAFLNGIRSIPPQIHEFLTVYGAGRHFRIVNVFLPMAAPAILTGARVSATLSVIGAVVAEFNGSEYGLGKNLYLAAKHIEPELMMISIVGASLIAAAQYGAVLIIERHTCRWYIEQQATSLAWGEQP